MKGTHYCGSFQNVERKKLGFKYLPKPDFYRKPIAKNHCVLITNDGSDLTSQLIEKFAGDNVVVLNFPQSDNKGGFYLKENSDNAVQRILGRIKEQHGTISNFIHLHPKFQFSGANFTQHYKDELHIIKSVFLIAKHLQADLNEVGQSDYARFMTVSQMDGSLGKGNNSNTSVFGGGLTGLVKCLNLEWSPVFCRAVDFSERIGTSQIADHVYQEFFDANRGIVEVAYDGQERKTPTETLDIIAEPTPLETSVTSDSVLLVSGGAKGVTATCIMSLAKEIPAKFILIGRSGIDFDLPAYATTDLDERALKAEILADLKANGKASLPEVKKVYKKIVAKQEIEETLETLRSYGSEVIYIKGDVTDPISFAYGLQQAEKQLGKVTGIIHGAGRLADKYIQDKSTEDFDNVISVKLDGLLSLIRNVDVSHLQHLIMFSSVAGYYGNVGQTDYAIANEILSKAAHLFKTNHPEIQVSAINWGAWDSGMVSGELKAQFEAMGVKLVNSEGGAAMFLNQLNTKYKNEPSVIIGGTLPAGVSYLGEAKKHIIDREISLQENPYLNDHVIQGKPVLPVVNAVGWMAQSCERLYPDFQVFEISNTNLFKGIVIDANETAKYTLVLEEQMKTEEAILFQATIQSEGRKLPLIHYKANIQIRNKRHMPAAPSMKLDIQPKQAEDGSVLYHNGALFHGPSFRGIEQIISYDEQHMMLSCKAPMVKEGVQGQFAVQSVNTFFSDIQYQGMVVWVQKYNDGAKSLPLSTSKVTLYKPIPFDKEMYVSIKIKESSAFKMEADCTVVDQAGTVYMETLGAAVTVSKQLQWES